MYNKESLITVETGFVPEELRWRLRDEAVEVLHQGITENVVIEMLTLMHDLDGIGLAANQVGLAKRMFVADFVAAINPVILQAYYYKDVDEGCLSIPGVSVKIGRAKKVKMKYFDIATWAEQEATYVDKEAHIVQHEIDHLNGVLCTDFNVLTGRT